jgi:hypothetical protein
MERVVLRKSWGLNMWFLLSAKAATEDIMKKMKDMEV